MIALWEPARELVHAPWREQGRSKAGVDCVGLIIVSMRALGVDPDPRDEITRNTNAGMQLRIMLRHCDRIVAAARAPGDVVFAELGGFVQVGILSPGDPLNVIYAAFGSGVTEAPFDTRMGKVRGYLRLRSN